MAHTTGRDKIEVEINDERKTVWNAVSVLADNKINSVNGYETFYGPIHVGDGSLDMTPDAVTKRVARILDDEFGIRVEERGIEVIDVEEADVI